MKATFKAALFTSLVFGCVISSQAAVQLAATRMIFPEGSDSLQLRVTNSGDRAQLVQSWVSSINNEKGKSPFIVTPPLFKMAKEDAALLNVVFINKKFALPADKETVFWLNVKSVAATASTEGAGRLELATTNQIKVFYRPDGLDTQGAQEAVNKLIFKRVGSKMVIENPTPYHVSMHRIKIDGKDATSPPGLTPAVHYMIPPKDKREFSDKVKPGSVILYEAIGDYGNKISSLETKLQ